MDDRILNFFKKHKDGYVSGEEISGALGISRTAVWKHIEKLRDEGYEIVASPHLGYRILSVPDRLSATELKWQLESRIIGKKIYSYMEIDSTNDTAYSLACAGEPEGAVVIAEYQRKGRGRLGRKWVSPKGKGAYFSVILRPDILPREIPVITLVASLGITKAIREATGLAAFIKWPNDILVNRKKVCGILTELNGEQDRINFVIVGVGININTKNEMLPAGATSLAAEKNSDVVRLEFVKAVLGRLDKYYGVFRNGRIEEILKEYKQLSAILDRQVEINYHNRLISGQAVDIDREGALIVRSDSGLCERVLAGDVSMLR